MKFNAHFQACRQVAYVYYIVLCSILGLCSLSLCHSRQYHVVYDQMNWADAQQHCRDKFTDLATIGSLEDVKTLNDMLDLHSLGNQVNIFTFLSYRHRVIMYKLYVCILLSRDSRELLSPQPILIATGLYQG